MQESVMDCYLDCGRRLYWSHTKETLGNADLLDVICQMTVSNTNLAFASEIGLKLLVYSETRNPVFKKHDLSYLFSLLSPTIQTAIRALTLSRYNLAIINQPLITEADFSNLLEQNKDAFVEGRYWYEQTSAGKKSTGNLFILSFAEAIKQFVDLFPFKEKMLWIHTEPPIEN